MEFVSYGQILNAFGEKKKSPFRFVDSFDLFAAGVYWPEGRHPILPFFQHSIIPSFLVGRKRMVGGKSPIINDL